MIILTNEIVTKLLCCRTDSDCSGTKLVFHKKVFLWIFSLTFDSCNSLDFCNHQSFQLINLSLCFEPVTPVKLKKVL